MRPSKDSDQPKHPSSLIRVFAVCMKKAWVLSYPFSTQQRLWSDWEDALADLSLRWAHTHFICFVMPRLKSWLSVYLPLYTEQPISSEISMWQLLYRLEKLARLLAKAWGIYNNSITSLLLFFFSKNSLSVLQNFASLSKKNFIISIARIQTHDLLIRSPRRS